MKRILPFLLFTFTLFCVECTYSQSYKINLATTMLKSCDKINKGENVNFTTFIHETLINEDNFGRIGDEFYLVDDKNRKIQLKNNIDDICEFHPSSVQDVWDSLIITEVINTFRKKGFQYELRKDMEDDALKYINDVKNYGLEFKDPYLESYIYSLISKIAPMYFIDGRPSSINILIEQNPSINACTFPNGTIIINTGLLAAMHTEDELIAILSHEIAHYVLDHGVHNVNKAVSRQKRAEFWAALATGVTAVAEGVAASKNDYYLPGLATVSMAALSTTIASQVIDRLGMKYNHDQEDQADMVAIKILSQLGYDKNALATSLSRIEKEYSFQRNNVMYFDSYTHPSLVERINNCGKPQDVKDINFEQIMSFAISNVASLNYEHRRFRQCNNLVSQNIQNKVATSDDYLLKANCLLSLMDTDKSNQQVQNFIEIAKNIDPNNINLYKTEIIVNLRMKKISDAISSINSYNERLNQLKSSLSTISSGSLWESSFTFIEEEQDWAKKMLNKLKGMNITQAH